MKRNVQAHQTENRNSSESFSVAKEYSNRKFNLFVDKKWLRKKESSLDALFSICNVSAETALLFKLLEKFTYFDGDDYSESLILAIEHMKTNWELDPEITQITAVAQDRTHRCPRCRFHPHIDQRPVSYRST